MIEQPLISIVDDDEGVRQALDGLVRSLGYRVATFDSAEGFLRSASAATSRCVISDVHMPGGMSGFDLSHELCSGGTNASVILMSAFVDGDVEGEARAAGAQCCLKKPFDGDVIITCLAKALER